MPTNADSTAAEASLIERAAGGDPAAWRDLVRRHHDRLRRMVVVRLDTRLQGRIDPSDVLQDVYLEASEVLPQYMADPECPLFLWLRTLTGDRISRLHRYHLGTQARDVSREVSLVPHLPEVSSASLALQLIGREHPPSQNAMRQELLQMVQSALAELEPLDREILALRHFEQLSTAETAQVLGVTSAAAAKRYFRSLRRLREALANVPGGPVEGL